MPCKTPRVSFWIHQYPISELYDGYVYRMTDHPPCFHHHSQSSTATASSDAFLFHAISAFRYPLHTREDVLHAFEDEFINSQTYVVDIYLYGQSVSRNSTIFFPS